MSSELTYYKALTEHFFQGNILLMHLINAKPTFISWRRSAFNEVNEVNFDNCNCYDPSSIIQNSFPFYSPLRDYKSQYSLLCPTKIFWSLYIMVWSGKKLYYKGDVFWPFRQTFFNVGRLLIGWLGWVNQSEVCWHEHRFFMIRQYFGSILEIMGENWAKVLWRTS